MVLILVMAGLPGLLRSTTQSLPGMPKKKVGYIIHVRLSTWVPEHAGDGTSPVSCWMVEKAVPSKSIILGAESGGKRKQIALARVYTEYLPLSTTPQLQSQNAPVVFSAILEPGLTKMVSVPSKFPRFLLVNIFPN